MKFYHWIHSPLNILLVIIFFGGIFFRFANTPDKFGFDKDPTRDALITQHIADTFSIPLVGPHSGIGSFSFGPWYYYQLGIFRLLTLGMIPPFYYIPLFSLLFIVGMYLLGKELWDKKEGVIFAGLAAFTPAQLGPIIGLSNPNLIPAHAIFSLLFFVYLLKDKLSSKTALLWGFIMGVGINNHYQMLPLLILPLVGFFYKRDQKRYFILFTLSLLASFIPFFIFNFQTHWSSIEGLLKYIREGGVYVPNSWTMYLTQFWPSYLSEVFGINRAIIAVSYAIILIFHIVFFYKKKFSKEYNLFLLISLVLFIHLRYFKGQREYYYMFYFLPFILVIFGTFLRNIMQFKKLKLVSVFAMLTLFLVALPINISKLQPRTDQAEARGIANYLIDKYKGKSISVYSCSEKNINIVEGVAYFLYEKRILKDNGVKILLIAKDDVCGEFSGVSYSMQINIEDLTQMSVGDLKNQNIVNVSPSTVYTNTVEWWDN